MTAVAVVLYTAVDHPGYFLDRCGDAVKRLRSNIDYIGQIQFADVPGRHESGTGEINYRIVFRAIYDLGDRYQGYLTAEYHPTDLSFRGLERVKRLASFGADDIG